MSASPASYIELHAHSYYSLLDGASSPRTLVQQAHTLGMTAIALTDHDNLYGAVVFQQACDEYGIQPIFGAEMTLEDGTHLTLLVRNAMGWANLCQLIRIAQHNAPKGEASLPMNALPHHADGLICLTGCAQGAIPQALIQGDEFGAKDWLAKYLAWFGEGHVWLELQAHHHAEDAERNRLLVQLAQTMQVGIVATNNVHYVACDDHRLQDVLVCIRHNTTLEDAHAYLRTNSEYYLKSADEMADLFCAHPQSLQNTHLIAQECQFRLSFGLQDLPHIDLPEDQFAPHYLRTLCTTSPRWRNTPPQRRQLKHELRIIQQAGLAHYFLLVWDIVRFAQSEGIRCQGRGSAANSLVAYLLGISPVDPIRHRLVFERFLSAERQVVPDIDIDFDAARREEVIQYVYAKYGDDHAAMACTFITYRSRSAMRDVGKALGIPSALLDSLTREVDRYGASTQESLREHTPDAPLWQHWRDLVQRIRGIPRHLGIHNGGMILMGAPLAQRLPTEPASMEGRVVVQWDKDSLEDAGIVKVDILGLRMLSVVAQASHEVGVDVDALDFSDPRVYRMISEADTVGVFQVESRAQMQMLPRFRPRHFNDLIIAISLIRPGPLQGDMVHPYLRRRLGEEPIQYFHPSLKPALQETLGVILFQEQVLKVARDMAGFTAGQGELLRRALGKKDAIQALEALRDDFVRGAIQNDVPEEIAQRVFQKLLGFGSYSFPKSHAAAFAVLVYQSAYIRKHHPVAFFTALLNNQPMGFYTPSVVVNDARRHGLRVLNVDIQRSDVLAQVVDKRTLRLGLATIRGMGEPRAQQLVEARQQAPFRSLLDALQRACLPSRVWEQLIQAGALDTWGERRALLWELGRAQHMLGDTLDLDASEEIQLPSPSRMALLRMALEATGVSADDHVMSILRDDMQAQNILHSRDIQRVPDGHSIQCAGLVVVKQAPPTAKGFRFLTLEDEWGFINVIVRPTVYEPHRRIIRQARVLWVGGTLQRERHVVNVLAEKFARVM
jgi:error-prone DNA polymerase